MKGDSWKPLLRLSLLIVVDTGSVDETPAIAKSFGAKVFHFPWCDDFARARNESLQHASGEWLFWMDSDDTITPECGSKLRALEKRPLDESPMAYVMQVHCPGPGEEGSSDVTVVDHVKLFRNLPELRFEGRIHEQVLASIRKLNGRIEFTDIYVVHSGSDHSPAGRRRKQERDLRLIGLELAEQPDHPFHLFNLGMTLADMGRHEEAVQALRRTLEVAQPHESHVRKAYALLVCSLSQLAQNVEALAAVESGLSLYPQDIELHFRRGIVLHHLDRREEAISAYRSALNRDEHRHFESLDPGIAGFKARHNLAVIYTELKQHAQAELQWRLALEEVSTYQAGWRGLCESLIIQRKFITCECELERMEAVSRAHLSHVQLRIDMRLQRLALAKARNQLDLVRQLLPPLQRDFPGEPDVLRTVSQFHFEKQDFISAEQSLEALTQLVPSDGAAWHNLGAVYAQHLRLDDAAKAFETSLSVRPSSRITQLQLNSVLESHQRQLACVSEV